MTTSSKLSPADLLQFSGGTLRYYRHGLNRNVLFTDGAKYVADEGGAYWLLDIIAISQLHDKRLRRQPFQVWGLAVQPDQSATLTVDDGNGQVLLTQNIAFTDFPGAGITLWFSGNVIYLPVEH
jgi:prepilin-type processing-associated H-X9-DG protein